MGYFNDVFDKVLDTSNWLDPEKPKDQIIKSIQVNEKKNLVTVVFTDNDVRIVKCGKDDNFDVKVGVALAISEHIFGSKTKRNKFIEEKAKVIKK